MPCPSQNKAFCSVDKSLLCLNQAEGQQKDLTDNALTRDHKTWTSKACRPACNPCLSYRRKYTHNTIQEKKGQQYIWQCGKIPHTTSKDQLPWFWRKQKIWKFDFASFLLRCDKEQHIFHSIHYLSLWRNAIHVPLLMPPLKHLLSLSRLPTHPRLPLLRPFSLPGVYFSSGQTIRQILYPGDSSWVIRGQTAPTKTLIYFSLSRTVWFTLCRDICVFFCFYSEGFCL